MKTRLPLHKALLGICVSVLLVSGSVGIGLLYWRHHRMERAGDPRYTIVAIIQSCDSNEPLQTDYLAELLGLSVDRPSNLYRFDTKEGMNKLLAGPTIKAAEIKKILPGMVYVKYTMRKPSYYIGDYTNTAMDSDGFLIPAKPFYTPKNIPTLVLGLPEDLMWGTNIESEKTDLAKKLDEAIRLINFSPATRLRSVDVSRAFSENLGQREIVLFFETTAHRENSHSSLQVSVVRFAPDNWRSQVQNYARLHERIAAGTYEKYSTRGRYVVDMRISSLAYIGGNFP